MDPLIGMLFAPLLWIGYSLSHIRHDLKDYLAHHDRRVE